MLMQLVVENFLSFQGAAVLSLVAVEGMEHGEQHCVRVPGLPPILKCAAVYGANASGKSNLLRAVDFVRNLVVRGTKGDDGIGVKPFKLDTGSADRPSRFELDLCCGGVHYAYGFVADKKQILEEWLLDHQDGEERLLFRRVRSEDHPDRPTIELGDALSTTPSRRQFLSFVAEGTRPNQLFLTEAYERNTTELKPLLAWFRSLYVFFPGARINQLAHIAHREPELRDFIADYLARAGTGVSEVSVHRAEAVEFPDDADDAFQFRTHHRSTDGSRVTFELEEESDGTQRLMHLAPFIYRLDRLGADTQRIYAVDELERSLHPLLTRSFVETFLASGSLGAPGQLLFTTHDTNLLDLTLLSRDSIWFTEKDPSGASTLYSLAEFKG
ncbi:MAG: ATP-binding protein, partial [Minicystis sp.]